MKTATLILIALLATACSTWAPKKTVTLRDVDSTLAESEGSDLRYLAAEPPVCKGLHGCRDAVTNPTPFAVYHWSALCDGRFCGETELRCVDAIREAAQLAFTAEQLVAAAEILARGDIEDTQRRRIEGFVSANLATLDARLTATEHAIATLPLDRAFGSRAARDQALSAVDQASAHLDRARQLTSSGRRTALR